MKLIHKAKNIKVFLANTKAIARDKRRGEQLITPLYSLYMTVGGIDRKMNPEPLEADEVKELHNNLINESRPLINVAELFNLED